MIQSKRIASGLLQLADPKIWTASLVPFILGNSLAFAATNHLYPVPALFALIVLILVEISKNGFNEYFDFVSGADQYVTAENKTPFSGGKKVIVNGILSLAEVGWISIIFLILALIASIPVILFRPGLIWFGLVGVLLSVAYSIPPLSLSYRGFGEVAVGFTFGPLIVNGTYFLHTATLDQAPILLSIPLGFMIAAVLWINEIPDVEADRKAHKWNLVARLGREKAVPGYLFLLICAYTMIAVSSILLRSPWVILAFSTLFIAIPAYKHLRRHVSNTKELMKANGWTIQTYLLTGILLSISSLIADILS
ncbi:MAG TPA: prenyltransferase [Acidobacteriota bacterium]|nr:prenyltransferase [Acidobacteriota bacterium]